MSASLSASRNASPTVLPLVLGHGSKERNLLVVLEGQGGNSAYHAGVLEYLARAENISIVGLIGTSGGAKTAVVAALGHLRDGEQGLIEDLYAYWHSVGREGDKYTLSFNPLMNMFAAANRAMCIADPNKVARTLESIDRHHMSEADLRELSSNGLYVGMNAVCAKTGDDIYFGVDHLDHSVIQATAAFDPVFPAVHVGEKRDARTGQIIFKGGPCRDGAQGGENPISIRALKDFERRHPELVGNYDVLVVSLGTKVEDVAHTLSPRFDREKLVTIEAIDKLRNTLGRRLHVMHADIPSHHLSKPFEIDISKVKDLSQRGFYQAARDLPRALGITGERIFTSRPAITQ